MPGGFSCRAVCGVSAHRPTPADTPGHPLHSILQGFAEPLDDVLADDDRSDDATVDLGPPRHPSAGRPGDDASADIPFTPPIPDVATDAIEAAAREAVPARMLGARASDLRALVPPFRRPSNAVLVGGLVLVVIAVGVTTSGERSAELRISGAGPYRVQPQRPATRPRTPRRHRRAVPQPATPLDRPSRRLPARPPTAPKPAPALLAADTPAPRAPVAAPPLPLTPRAGATSEFTSEFTP